MCSDKIEMVVEQEFDVEAPAGFDVLCTDGKMLVMWIQNQLRRQQTKDSVFNYVNQVIKIQNPASVHKLNPAFKSIGRNNIFRVLQLCERLPSPMGESEVDCNLMSTLPDVSFMIGNTNFTLTPDQV